MDEIKGIRILSLTGEKEYGIEDSEVRQDVEQLVEGAPEAFDTFKEIAEYIAEDGATAAEIIKNVAANAQGIADEITRAKAAEEMLEVQIADEAARATAALAAEKTRAEQAEQAIVEDTDKKIAAEIDKIKDGDTIVGQAREIHSRNGKTVTDSFLIRTTAGSGTIGDGVASLKSVGGNIVKNLASLANFKEYNSNIVKDADIYKITRVGTNFGIIVAGAKLVTNHKYYTSYYVKGDAGKYALYIGDNVLSSETIGEVWVLKSAVVTNTGTGRYILISSTDVNVNEFFVAKTINIDLTEMFGAGNEPDKATCDKLFGTMDALPQGLTVAKPNTFTSIGFNQFNPDNVLEGKAIVDNAIVPGDKKIAVISCLPCKVGTGENNGYCIHGEFGDDIKVYLTPLNPKYVDGELYMHELTKDATTDTYVPQIKGYLLVEVPTTANLCAHFLWSEDKCERDTYEPYHESKIELPTIPQMSEWGLAGIQSSGTLACDEIDFERGVYVKRIGGVDLGSLTITKSGILFVVAKPDNISIPAYGKVCNAVIGRYSIYRAYSVSSGELSENGYMVYTDGRLFIYDTTYTDVNAFKQAMQGVMLYYELATPEEYPLPKVDNNYISSDYGVEQFDSNIPCNANNLYYMRSLAGETRNFLDRMYDNTAKSDAKEVADYITNNLADKIPLATAENNGLMSATAFSSIGEVIDITEEDEISFYVGSNTNKTVFNYYTKSDNCTITATLKNVVGNYYSVRFYLPSTYNLPYVIMEKCSNGNYFGSKSLIGLPKGSLIQIKVFTNSTNVGSVNENSVIEIKEQSYKGNVRPRVDIFTSDTQLEVFEKMLYANNIGHCDVHFQMGTYIFDETLYDWMRSERKYSRAELPIGGNCRYFFNGATLIGSYAGEDTHVARNCNVLGCALTSGNFELHDGTIIANDIIYGVHDDGGVNAMGDSHLHKYSNMHIIYNGGTHAKDTEICKCIGGGTCKNLTVVIDNCVLEKYTENVNKDCVTYHGFSNNPSYQTKARIVITNTWMTGACRAYHLVAESRNETIEFVVSNCRTNVTINDVDKLITWNNEPIS